MKAILQNPDAWSEIADGYDATAREILTPFSEEAIRLARLTTEDEVLDVACGPGTTTLLAAPLVGSVQAVDFASGMIDALRRNTLDLNNVDATVGDGQKLTFEAGRFSAAFSMFGLMFFPDPVAGLAELHRVLRPGGRAIISSWVPLEDSPRMQPFIQALLQVIPPPPEQKPPAFSFDQPDQLAAAFEAAGFVDVEVHRFAPQIAVGSPALYWAESRGNILVNYMRTAAGDAWPEMERKIEAYLAETLAGVDTLAMPAFIAVGRRA